MKAEGIPLEFDRLFLDALNPEELRRLQLSLGTKASPGWLKLLQDCLLDLNTGASRHKPNLSIEENLALPMATYFARKFLAAHREGINQLMTRSVWRSLERSLRSRLASTARFAAQWAWQVFCGTPGLRALACSDSTTTRLARIYFKEGIEKRTIFLLCANPALARLWAVQAELWLKATGDFLQHAEEFAVGWKQKQRFRITAIAPDQSDLHRGNRSVIHVRLNDGSEWYYKPRSGNAELLWAVVLKAAGPFVRRRFHKPQLIAGDGHCWMESVSHKPCRNSREAREFFFKAGVILSLLHRLRGVDFHADNLIAHGSQPVLTDCEALLHPPVDPLLRSIRGTGFLPMFDQVNGAGDSLSALSRITFGPHAVMVGKRRVYASDFCDAIVAGFEMPGASSRGRRSITSALSTIVQETEFRFSRHLFRSTAEYNAILDGSLRPGVLRSSSARRSYLKRLCRKGGHNSFQIEAEVAALEQNDIPIFHGTPAPIRRLNQNQLKQEVRELGRACRHLSKRVRLNAHTYPGPSLSCSYAPLGRVRKPGAPPNVLYRLGQTGRQWKGCFIRRHKQSY